ncbi:hypothetical protein TNCV_2450931 [Trichonephila clavipes]|nr:hypothetical protein TNCV_2450931 [Trichonephila clavipes]
MIGVRRLKITERQFPDSTGWMPGRVLKIERQVLKSMQRDAATGSGELCTASTPMEVNLFRMMSNHLLCAHLQLEMRRECHFNT